MKKTKLVFVILQYNSYKETIECVDSILKNTSSKQYEIIVVENGSKNNSAIEVQKKYSRNKKVHIIINEKNRGFSKGNNVGCEFAIKNFNPKFLYVINNDTLIQQKNTIEIIKKEYKKSKFDVLGPDVIDLEGNHGNPFEIRNNFKMGIMRRIFLNRLKMFLTNMNFISVLKKIKPKEKQNKKWPFRQEEVGLYACALIFSNKYYQKFKKIFYPEIFLYGEEDFLDIRRKREKLKFVYNPELKIIHKEEKSAENKNSKKHYLFRLRQIIKSDRKMLEFVKDR